jgi:hypothetical protein
MVYLKGCVIVLDFDDDMHHLSGAINLKKSSILIRRVIIYEVE